MWNEAALVNWFKDAWPGPLVREFGWLFSFAESMHFIGLCILFGALFFIDLRLMGYYKNIPVKAVLSLVPFAALGLIINMLTGWMFFTSAPKSYMDNPAFILKMILVVIATANAIAFTLWEHRKVAEVGPGQDVPFSAKFLGGSSLALWLVILLLGRWLPLFTVGTN